MTYRPSRRTRRYTFGAAAVLALAGLNGPAAYHFGSDGYHRYRINRPAYKAANGHWDALDVPRRYRINTIHAALLHTGKVLLIAGSGNNTRNFAAHSFRSVLWDPRDNSFTSIPTPKDMFCAGHTQLPDGHLLVAGGTQRYEKLEGDVDRAGGLMFVHNENPEGPRTFPAGTLFTGRRTGLTFRSQDPVLVPRAKKTKKKVHGKKHIHITASTARVYVEALHEGRAYQTGTEDNYRIRGLTGKDARNLYGIAQKLSFDKKDFQGIREAYEFDPVAERYVTVDPMHEARWYPTLTTLRDGRVLAVSGLDEIGQVVPGKNEIYDPVKRTWRYLPHHRFFPTYPALFLTEGGRIFYTGSNAGYGPADVGRTPGLWDWKSNEFHVVPGISAPHLLETSMSVLLPPAQRQRFMVLGGGGVGESDAATDRTRIVDLRAEHPRFHDGPRLYARVRYPSSVILPDDTVLTTNGSGDYRGRRASDVLRAELYDPATGRVRPVAAPLVGRNYHSGGLLLPDGRVLTFGSDSLFGDRTDSTPGTFQQRIDLFTPPYLFHGPRPTLRAGGRHRRVRLGEQATFRVGRPESIRAARLVRPGAFTHVTNVEQRSIALEFTPARGRVTVTLPKDASLVPPGWYMLHVVDQAGVPSKAVWLKVTPGEPLEQD